MKRIFGSTFRFPYIEIAKIKSNPLQALKHLIMINIRFGKTAIFTALLLSSGLAFGQNVGIGTNTPDQSAKLHIEDSNRGLLIPNLNLTDVTVAAPVTAPATGLLVWNTNAGVTGGSGIGFYYWDGTVWQRLATGAATSDAWQLQGNGGTNASINFLGTTDATDMVFRTDGTENMRINFNGNVGIGTTSNAARLYTYVPGTDATTNYALYNYFDGGDAGTTYGIRNQNYGSGDGAKYGIYNNVNSEGTGTRYGIYSTTSLNSGSNSSGYGIINYLYPYGSSAQYGIYNYVSSSSATGTQYGQRNYLYLATANTNNAYGEYTYVDYSSGSRFGEYKQMNSSSTYNGNVYGDYNQVYGTGGGIHHGTYNEMDGSGSGDEYSVYNLMDGNGTGTKYGMYNEFTTNVTSTRYGVRNEFADANGTKYGMYNYFPSGSGTGTIYGVYNNIQNDANATKYGAYNYISGGDGALRGSYNSVYPATTNTSTIYGVYSYVSSNGTGTHYGGYFSAYGDNNRAVYGTNTHTTGWAGYYIGNFYADGNSIFNESGNLDHDFRIETDTRTHALFSDAGNDVIRFGYEFGSLNGNGSSVGGTTVEYLADFDNGSAEGSGIGIGSIEFLLDGSSRTKINNDFVPATHMIEDLGYTTTSEAWDDVYADNYVNVSDKRAKTDITNLSYGLTEVMAMRPVRYKLIDDPFQEPKLGLIAQEVLPLVSEAVKTHDHKILSEETGEYEEIELERMGMTYNSLIPVLIKAIQDQQEIIEKQEARIEALEAAISK